MFVHKHVKIGWLHYTKLFKQKISSKLSTVSVQLPTKIDCFSEAKGDILEFNKIKIHALLQ
jgi:hypothetical protein